MLEIPESKTIVEQINETLQGKVIAYAEANHSPHGFAWYFGDPAGYDELLSGKRIGLSHARGGMVEIEAEDCRIVFGDGVAPRYYEDLKKVPEKHQLYIEFDDQTALVGTVQMYGGLWAYREGENNNPYYLTAVEKPSPLSTAFDYEYFLSLRNGKTTRMSAKAFLATEQRIPGLGNGVLQDILLLAGIHPKRKMTEVSEEEYRSLFETVKQTLLKMTEQGGRDTEKDLFGNPGGYTTLLSKKTYGKGDSWSPCPLCGNAIHKASYMGGTIYYCEKCQK